MALIDIDKSASAILSLLLQMFTSLRTYQELLRIFSDKDKDLLAHCMASHLPLFLHAECASSVDI